MQLSTCNFQLLECVERQFAFEVDALPLEELDGPGHALQTGMKRKQSEDGPRPEETLPPQRALRQVAAWVRDLTLSLKNIAGTM